MSTPMARAFAVHATGHPDENLLGPATHHDDPPCGAHPPIPVRNGPGIRHQDDLGTPVSRAHGRLLILLLCFWLIRNGSAVGKEKMSALARSALPVESPSKSRPHSMSGGADVSCLQPVPRMSTMSSGELDKGEKAEIAPSF